MTRQFKSHYSPTSPEVPTHTQSDGKHFKEALSEGLHDTSVHMKERNSTYSKIFNSNRPDLWDTS